TPRTSTSHRPDPSPRATARSASGSQPLKSPITETDRAFGAQTAKRAPLASRWQPSLRYSRACVPSRKRWMSCSPRNAGEAAAAGDRRPGPAVATACRGGADFGAVFTSRLPLLAPDRPQLQRIQDRGQGTLVFRGVAHGPIETARQRGQIVLIGVDIQ